MYLQVIPLLYLYSDMHLFIIQVTTIRTIIKHMRELLPTTSITIKECDTNNMCWVLQIHHPPGIVTTRGS